MPQARIICIGKLKADYWKAACGHYLKLLAPMRQVEVVEARDAPTSLPSAERKKREAKALLDAIAPGDLAIALCAGGRQLDSPGFAQFLRSCDEQHSRRPAFLIGGPLGLDAAAISACPCQLSLSPMTWPHEMARVLLLEQLFRAETILRHRPYHY